MNNSIDEEVAIKSYKVSNNKIMATAFPVFPKFERLGKFYVLNGKISTEDLIT